VLGRDRHALDVMRQYPNDCYTLVVGSPPHGAVSRVATHTRKGIGDHSEIYSAGTLIGAQLTKRLANDYRCALQCKRRHDGRDDEIGRAPPRSQGRDEANSRNFKTKSAGLFEPVQHRRLGAWTLSILKAKCHA